MFDSLSDKVTQAFKKLTGKGTINESSLNDALREIRIAFLEADVALSATKTFIENIKSKALGKTVLEALGEAINLEPDFFPNMVTDGNSICRLLHYPATRHLDTQHSVRAAAHADINLLTLLVGATDSGLELLDQNGDWKPVVSSEEEIVLDTGEMISRLTNDVLPATVHRVVNPINQERSRYSMPFFLHPHSKASLECLPQCVGPEC